MVTYTRAMDDDRVFRALADPSRRLLLDCLFERDGRTLTDLQSRLAMTRFGVMKHLRVLEEGGLVATRKVGREKLHYLNPVPVQSIYDRWIGKFTAARASALVDLKTALEGVKEMAVTTKPQQVYVVYIKAPRERVWDAITKAEFTSRYFFGAIIHSDLKAGSPLNYTARDGTLMVDGSVVECDPPRRLAHTFQVRYDPALSGDPASRVTWELEQEESGVTKVTVLHDGFETETGTYQSVAGGWPRILSALKTLLETGESMPMG